MVSPRWEFRNLVERCSRSSFGLFHFSASLFLCGLLFVLNISGQNKYENRQILEPIDITFEGNDRDLSAAEQFRLIARNTLGEKYSSVRIRGTIQAIYDTKKVVSVTVEASEAGTNAVLGRVRRHL